MAHYRLDRRQLMLAGSATLLGAASPGFSFAAPRKLAPGGFSAERLARIPPMLQRYVDDGSSAGFVTLLFRKGEIAQVSAIGWQDTVAKIPMKRDTIFRLASMTKPVTCTAALMLMEQGKIGLFEPIDRYIPELAKPRVLNRPDGPLNETHPAPRAITLADLLTHRSGVGGAVGDLQKAMADLRTDDPTMDVWLKRLGALPLAYDPGSTFNYGTSHDVLGALIYRITGMKFGDYLKSALFDLLGMKDTGFWMPPEKQGRLAATYRADATGKMVNTQRQISTKPTNFEGGAGGLCSTADDYLKFARMLLDYGRYGDTRFLTRPTIKMMTTNWLTPEQRAQGFSGSTGFWGSQGFGLGVAITDDVSKLGPNPYTSVGSFGWNGATGVWWKADPAEEMVSIFMVQNTTSATMGPLPPPAAARATAVAGLPPTPAAAPAGPRRVPPVVAFLNEAYAAIEA